LADAYHSAGFRIDQVELPASGTNHGLNGQAGTLVLVIINLKPSLRVHAGARASVE
jgi:hypothetical protein